MRCRPLPAARLAGAWLGLTLAVATPALAQQGTQPAPGWSGMLGLGPAIIPEYDGADSSTIAPFLLGDLAYGPYFLELRGLSLRANLLPSRRIVAGPVLRLGSSRDDDVDSDRVSRLDEIDAALEAGGFIGFRFGGDARGQGQVELTLTGTGSKNGFLGTAGLSYAALRSGRLMLSLDAELNYVDGPAMRTFFGVTRLESQRADLPAYRPAAGLRDVGIGVTAGWQFSDRWGLVSRLSYSHLLGDAADSPIVDQEGSRGQLLGGLALTYRF